MINNLQDVECTDIRNNMLAEPGMIIKPETNAYDLSMIMLINSFLGYGQQYNAALSAMTAAMNAGKFPDWAKGSEAGMKAWMYGRMLAAANNMGNTRNAKDAIDRIEASLKIAQPSAFTAWAWGYLAAGLEGAEYTAARDKMVAAGDSLTTDYLAKPTDAGTPLWAWVMSLPAAAHANDEKTYDYGLEQIRKIVGASVNDTEDAFVKKLFDKFPPGDYRAWGLAIMRLAAATINDKKMFDVLEQPTQAAIAATTIWQDKSLAQLNNQLAQARAESGSKLKIQL
ncbi:MAG: hypothetical protein ACHQAX_03035 [Gammaproteobacteria bacterium]